MTDRIKVSLILAALALSAVPVDAQTITEDFAAVSDSISARLVRRTTVHSPVRMEKIMKRDGCLDFYFSATLEDHPLTAEDAVWLREEIEDNMPAKYSRYKVGRISTRDQRLESLIVPELSSDGSPVSAKYRTADPKGDCEPLVEQVGGMDFPKGMSGRHIALWQSHGRYWEPATERWEWQRAPNFQTVEDMYTQSYVLPFLIPMLENAGAYVMTPRERDVQCHESICDNDPAFSSERGSLVRTEGKYSESGSWSDAGVGFADAMEVYPEWENPFSMGTVRMAECARNANAQIRWTPDIPQRGEYAVYVAYKTLSNSTEAAHYTVRHLGGETEFIVNQTMGGGTWIYLGTFEFDEGGEGCVTLDNGTPEGRSFRRGSVVTADAVKFGGGMGRVSRGSENVEASISGLPAFTEGALYWMQFAGIDTTLHSKWQSEYTKEYASRGAWVSLLSGGSRVNPTATGKGIPFDLSMAFHTDAGVTPNDSIIGTLSIYTLNADGSSKLPDGESRWLCRELAEAVQSQIVQDVRADFEPSWSRRMLWNRSYSESRTTSVPGLLLELLSHQNFADMKYGLDPSFRFEVSRAVYKGMLKFLSNRYGCSYVVQPLPVSSFAAALEDGQVRLSWTPTEDSHEPTARPEGYILYTRVDDGAFDTGKVVSVKEAGGRLTCMEKIRPGHVYSFKVVAYNKGGKSFPSEVLSAGVADDAGRKAVLIVNNFDRVSAPAWVDTPDYAGFDGRLDGGVPYIREINFIGEQYQFRRNLPWLDDDNAGFGASYTDKAGNVLPGNTFDFPSVHGKAILESGHSFCSASKAAFVSDSTLWGVAPTLDLICGKQVTTKIGSGAVPARYEVFPEDLQAALRSYTRRGGSVLLSGANIGTDVWDAVYPLEFDADSRARTQAFVQEVLGYKWLTNYASRSGQVKAVRSDSFRPSGLGDSVGYYQEMNPDHYWVETPDGIVPASDSACSVMRYTDTDISAGVLFDGGGYRVLSFGFPLETIVSASDLRSLMAESLSALE